MTTLADAVGLVEVAEEDRTGYTRSSFKHWDSGAPTRPTGATPATRALLAEAVVAPTVGAGCKLTDGTWTSYYDGQEVTSAGAFDIDRMVPLAEVWDSGASAWTAARREAYANDQSAAREIPAASAAREVAVPTAEVLTMAPTRFGVRRLVFLCRRDPWTGAATVAASAQAKVGMGAISRRAQARSQFLVGQAAALPPRLR